MGTRGLLIVCVPYIILRVNTSMPCLTQPEIYDDNSPTRLLPLPLQPVNWNHSLHLGHSHNRRPYYKRNIRNKNANPHRQRKCRYNSYRSFPNFKSDERFSHGRLSQHYVRFTDRLVLSISISILIDSITYV